MPARPSYEMTVSASTMTDNRQLEIGDGNHLSSHTLRRPRGRPPLHPSRPVRDPHEEPGGKRTWKRKDAGCSSSELRQHHLQRNRVAASKYRQKHKTWSDTLTERYRTETDKRKHLQDLARSLKDEVLSLKEEAIHQSGCDCMIMKLYLERQTVNLLGLPKVDAMSPLAISCQEPISPTSSCFTSTFDDHFFSDFV